MTEVNEGSSVLGWTVLPGAAGALGGYELAKRADFGIPGKRYSSFDDIINEKQDTFKKLEDKVGKGDNAEAKEAVKAVKDAKAKYLTDVKALVAGDKVHWDAKVEAEGRALDTAAANVKEEYNKLLEKCKDLYKQANPDAAIDDEMIAKTKKVIAEDLKKVPKDGEEDICKGLREALTQQKTAREALAEKAKTQNAKTYKNAENLEKSITDLKTKAWESVKESAGKLKGASKLWTAVAGGVALALVGLLVRPKAKNDVA